jgi:oligopeptide/dipeptide ABC transporter ATP-binding protein
VLVLKDGRLVEAGTTREVFRSPVSAHTQALLDAVPRVDAAAAPPPAGHAELLAAEQVSLGFRASGRRLSAVNSVDLAIKKRETVAIVGESGSGKSSLARLLTGLAEADAGTLTFDGKPLARDLESRPRAVRRALQLVFQDPVGSLDPQMRIEAIIAEPLDGRDATVRAAERRRRVLRMLDAVGLDERYLERYPHELSGGQAQRVAIARALITGPAVLICDEAVAALDGTVRRQILRLLAAIQRDTDLGILFISHDLGIVREISHRVVVMYLGRVVEVADTGQLFSRPRHPYTRALLDAIPVADPDARRTTALLPGEVPSILEPPPGCPFHPRCRYAIEACAREAPTLDTIGSGAVACLRAGELDLGAEKPPPAGRDDAY